jgi:hypothetical protein
MSNGDFYLLQIILMGLGKDERVVGSIIYVNYPSLQPCIYLETTQFSQISAQESGGTGCHG